MYDSTAKVDKAKFYEGVRANAEMVFEQICKGEKAESDIIALDLHCRLPFYITKSHIKQALVRGAVFEINYGSGMFEFQENGDKNLKLKRQNFLSNAMTIVRLSKGRGVILTSDVNRKVFMRSPIDCVNMTKMLGMSQDQAMNVTTKNC